MLHNSIISHHLFAPLQFKRLKLQRNNWDSDAYDFDEVLTEFALQKHVYEVVAKPVFEVRMNYFLMLVINFL